MVTTGGCTINSKRSQKQLGVMIDDKLKFGSHVEYACKRASMAIKVLSKIMSNSSVIVSSKGQREWDSSSKGRWAHRLIPSVSKWTSRPHGEVNFHLTQFLSGYGCFRWYLHRFGHAGSPACPECADCDETAEHVLCECPRFVVQRSSIAGGMR